MTVGELLDYIRGLPLETPVVVDVNTDGGYLRVEDLNLTTAQGKTDDLHELQVWWDAEPGWIQRLVSEAERVRSDAPKLP